MLAQSLGVVNLPAYLVGLVLIIVLPGPNTIYVLSVAARRGVRSGYQAASAVWIGDGVLMTLSAVGAASLLQANQHLFALVKLIGAGYLVYLAHGMLRAALALWRTRTDRPLLETVEEMTREQELKEHPFRRALTVSLLNPKAILFFVSFFVQFVDPGYAHPALSFLVLGLLCTAVSATYLTFLIFSGARLAATFRKRRRLSAGAAAGAGALFLAFAAKLTVS